MPDQRTNLEQLSDEGFDSGAINGDDQGYSGRGSDSTPLRTIGPPAANRHRLPNERPAITHHFAVGGHEGYLTVGLYPNGEPGEIFIRMAKEGSTIAGLMECFGTVVSVSLQHGVPLRVLCDKLSHTRFEPSGWTGNERSASPRNGIISAQGSFVPHAQKAEGLVAAASSVPFTSRG